MVFRMTPALGLCFFLLVSCTTTVWSTAEIKVTFLGYDNPSGQEQDGGCCDGIDRPGCPVGKCDHSFEFCIKELQGKQDNCFTFVGPPDRNSITDHFVDTFSLGVLEENYTLTINVTDINTKGNVPVDIINVDIQRDGNRLNFTTLGSRPKNPTTITLSTETSCKQYYYLANCTKKCVRADNCNGHYTCSKDTGDLVCNNGWRGPTCTELIPGSKPDCSIYQSSGFVSSSWSGLMMCSSDTRNFSMNITKTTEDKIPKVSGYVTIDQVTTTVTGLFSSGRNSLFLYDGPGRLSIDSTMNNNTGITGVVTQDGTICPIDLSRIEGYFDACDGRGTCIRYDHNKDDYCCCYYGTDTCSAPATSRTTTVKTSTAPTTGSSEMMSSTDITTEGATDNSSTRETTSRSSTEVTITQTIPTENATTATTFNTTGYSSQEPAVISTTPQTSASQSTVEEVSLSDSTTTLSTTSTETTVQTTSPTTTETTVQTTSPTTSETTVQTTSPTTTETTVQTTTTTPTTTASTAPTTTEKPTVFEPTEVYRLMFEAVEEEMEGEEENLVQILKLAWEEANALIFPDQHGYNISILNMTGAIGEKGVLVVEISYTVSINVTEVDVSRLVTPTKAHLTKALQGRYHTELYTGVTILYLEYSFSLYISGRPPLVDQYLEINQNIYDIWNMTMGTETFNITTSAVEEYIGANGEEITRIYYFLYANDTMIHPADVTQPNVTSLVTLGRYELYQHQEVRSIVRYRLTFSINIIGEVTSMDQSIIRDRIHLTWNETDMLITNVNIILLRCERYIEPNGDFITKVIYKVTSENSTVYSVLQSPPNTSRFDVNLNVNNTRGEVFRLYHEVDLFRYSFHLGLYVLDKIDTTHDIDKLVEGLENAWKEELITQDWDIRNFKVRYITVKQYIGADGRFADMLLYFMTENHRLVDGTQYKELDVTVLQKYIQVTKMSGERYQLVSAQSADLVEMRLHFTITLQGVVLTQDRKFLTGVILGAWKQVEGIAAVLRHVYIRAVEEMVTEEGMIVSRLFYTFTRTEASLVKITNPLEKVTATDRFYGKVKRNLFSLSFNKHQNYNLYMGKETLYSRRYTFDLYFETELARLDFVRVEVQLSKYLQQHLNLNKDVKVKIIKQEEYFLQQVTQTSGVARPRHWRIFYVIHQDSALVYPGLHKKVQVKDLAKSFSVTGITGVLYKLYQGETTQLLDYSYQFFLHFRERVSPKDWFKIKPRLEKAWLIQFEVNVSVQIQEVEEVISTEGVSYWRLVYCMTDTSTNTSIYPGNWKSMNLETVHLDFTNIYGYTYTVVDYTRVLRRISAAFRLIASESVTEYSSSVNKALSKTWCDKINGLGYKFSCDHMDIVLIRRPHIKLSSGISIWRLYYFLKYDGIKIDFLTWPKFDLEKFTLNIGQRFPIRFYHWFDFDLSFWNFQFFLSFKSRVEKKDYPSATAAILETFKKTNAEYSNSTNIKVVVDTQNEVLTETGKWEWKLGYHIEVNGAVIKPEETHVNTTQIQTILKTSNTSLEVNVESSGRNTYTSSENLGSIYVKSPIHKEDYAKFTASLEEYYRNKTGASSNISIVVGPAEEVITKDGKSEWKLTYSVKENGQTIRPSPINTTEEKDFLRWFHFKSRFGLEYKLKFGSTTHVHSKKTIFGINMKAKVSTSSYSDIETKLSQVIVKTNPDLITSNTTKVSVKILGQQELVTDSGETVWRLNYGVYVNGAKVDFSYLKIPSRKDLEKLWVFKGPNGIENGVSEVSVTETHTTVSLHELRLNRPMSQTDVTKISEAVRASWAKVLNVSESELLIDFKASNEYVMKNGKSSWGWTYSLKWNSTILTRTDLSIHELKLKQELKARLVAVVTSRGDNYTLVDETFSLEYAKHFPIYFSVKVAQKDIEAMKEKLESVWTLKKGINVSIDISTQKEVIDKSGKSYWELVYFVSTTNTTDTAVVLDSRVEEYKNVTTLLAQEIANVTDVNGQSYTVVTSVDHLFRADQTFSLFLSAKFDKKVELKFKETIETTVRRQLKVMENASVTVDVLKHEEVTTRTFESAWKYLFSIKVDGRTLSPLSTLNGSWPHFELVTSTGHRVTILSNQTATSYFDFRNSFSFYMEKNVSFSSWVEIKSALNRSWSTLSEYKACACLDFVLGSIREVVDSKGNTFYKVLYFMKQNTTMVDAMTHRKLSTTILKSELKNIRSVQDQHNTVVEVVAGVTTRVDTLFGFFLKKKVRIDHWSRMEKSIEKAYKVDNNIGECCTSVRFLRQIPYITVKGQVLWKVEYQLLRENVTLDAEVTTGVNVTSVQSEIHATFASAYAIEEVQKRELIDYRNKVELYFSAPIAEEHLIKIKQAVNISYSVTVTDILILSNQEMIDNSGTSLWKLSVFIYEGGKDNVVSYVPGWGLATVTINMTRLMSEVKSLKIEAVHGVVEMLEITGEGLSLYEQSLSILVKNVIKTVDIVNISVALTNLWNTTLRESVEEKAITVKVSRQEELVDIDGNTISRLVYFLKMDEKTLTADELPPQNETRIQATLTSWFKERYEVVLETEMTLLRYESLFAFYMASPVLLRDTHEFQQRLEAAWKTKFASSSVVNVTSRILIQEELTDGMSLSKTFWRVSYSLERDSKKVDSRSEVGLSVTEIKAVLNTKFTTTSTNYSHILLNVTVAETIYRYTDLFSLHIKNRVAAIDYTKFETSLAMFWKDDIKGATATVCKQEEELDSHGESVWKLSYVRKKNNTLVSSQKIVQASADVIMKSVNVTSPRGLTYTIVDVTETVRMEEVYQLYVTRKVFRDDVTHFTASLQETIENIVPGDNSTNIHVEWKGQTQFKHITDSKSTAWRQLFLVKMNNKYITPLNYGSLNKEKITFNFTSIRGDNYDLINRSSVSTHFARADEQFSITVIGRIKTRDQVSVKMALQTSWDRIYSNDTVTINIQSTEEYIGDNSIIVTRLSLFALRGISVIDPDTMKTPSLHDVLGAMNGTNGPSLVAYTGRTVVRYQSCFTLLVKGTLKMAQQTNLLDVLKQAWQYKTGVYDKMEILVHKTEKFVGEFGVGLTQVLYTARINARLSEADDDLPPTNADIEAHQPDAKSSWKVYSGKVSYRLEAMYSIKVESLILREVTSQQIVKLEKALLGVWTHQYRNECLSCQIRVVGGTSYYGYNSSGVVRVSDVSYTVTRNGDVITPWVLSSPTRANMAVNIDSQSAGVSVWLRPTYKVRNLYLVGYTSKIDLVKLRTGIHKAWLGSLGESTNVSGEIRDVNVYVDKQWQKLTRVQYFVSLNSTDPDLLVRPAPTTDDVNKALTDTGIQQHLCDCVGLKLRKMHVKGASVNYTAVAAAVKKSWIDKNNASSSLETSLEVDVKQLQVKRTRRAVTPAAELVDDKGKTVSPADYTVSIDGQAPDPLFVQPPSQEDIDRSLQASGIDNCNCKPGKVGHVKLKGPTKEAEKNDVAEAVKDAIAKSNPGVSPADLDVQILDVNNHDEDGGPVSDVKYAVRRHDNGDVGALSSPSEASLSEALNAKGKSLASEQKTPITPPTSENTDWQVPTAVLCSVFAFILICIAVFYFVYVRRHRQNASLKEAEENIENNIHNEEHFTKPVIFNNPMYGSHQAKHTTVGTDGL